MPKVGHPPAFLFYPDDFSSDGKVEAMTTEEVGAYMLLLCKSWRESPVASLPSDDLVLARWARLTPDRWSVCKPSVLAPFKFGPDSRWHQKRLRLEYDKLIAVRKERKKAAKARWEKNIDANALHKQCIPSPIPSPIKEREEKRNTYARAWPPDLFLSQAMREYAIAGGVSDPEKEFAAWHDDCLAHGRTYKNWMAAWRTRINNYPRFAGGKNAAVQQPKSFDAIRREEGDAATRRLLDRHLGRTGEAREALPALPGRAGKADLHRPTPGSDS